MDLGLSRKQIHEARTIRAAKRAARIGKAKQAHDSLIAAAHRTQADALEIEAQAKRRLAWGRFSVLPTRRPLA